MREKIAENIYFIPGRRKGHYPHCNSLLLEGRERVVIDPAADKKEMILIAGDGVEAVLVSHYHTDHMRYLKHFPGAKVYVHQIEAPALQDFDRVLDYVFYPEESDQDKWKERKLREVGGWGFKVDHAFTDGEIMVFGDTEVQAIHTPGHTPGHSCFWFPAERVLYSADFDFTEFGPWYGNAASSVDQFLASIQKLKTLKPRLTVTAHEMGIIEGDITERLDQFASIILEREARMLEHLKEPLTLGELTDKAVIYGRHYSTENFTAKVEQRMVRHHLESLTNRGLVRKEGERYIHIQD
jgi:glyoxylase-like metal-dependent hydrolase (beta-lactamase superfamily II)